MAARITPNNLLYKEDLERFSEQDIRLVMERIFRSRHFVHAPRKRKFLQLICDFYLNDRASELNEYLIGCEVFDRDENYNPSADPIVRVGAHDVRKKLELYYQDEGTADEIRLAIPIGSYEPVFIRRPGTQTVAEPVPEPVEAVAQENRVAEVVSVIEPEVSNSGEASSRKQINWSRLVIGVLSAVVLVLSFALLKENRQTETSAPAASGNTQALGTVWLPFLRNESSTLLVLSNPVVYRSANSNDPEALTRNAVTLTPEQAGALSNASGNRLPLKPDRPVQLVPAFNMYTGIGEAIGIYRLSGLLQSVGERVVLKQSRSIGPDDLKANDVILLGSVYSNQWSKPLSIRENFVYTDHASIENLNPAAGELPEYTPLFDSRGVSLIEDYALITVTPGVSGENTIMTLAGIYSEGTQAAVEFVTTANSINELNQRLQQLSDKNGAPKYYQVLLKVRVENSFPTKTSLLTLRPLQMNPQ